MIDSVPSAVQDGSASELISAAGLPLDSDSGTRSGVLVQWLARIEMFTPFRTMPVQPVH